MIRRPPRSTQSRSSAASDVYKRQIHTRQNNPYRLGAAPAGVVGARGRCCPAATVPVAVVLPRGVCCCIAENKQNTIINRKQSSAIIVHKPKRTATSTRTIHTRLNKPYRLGAVRAGVVGARGRCCPAAAVPVAVVLPCGVCCCFAENKQVQQRRCP